MSMTETEISEACLRQALTNCIDSQTNELKQLQRMKLFYEQQAKEAEAGPDAIIDLDNLVNLMDQVRAKEAEIARLQKLLNFYNLRASEDNHPSGTSTAVAQGWADRDEEGDQ